MTRHCKVYYPTRPQFDDEEQEDRAEKQIDPLKEITGPHFARVVLAGLALYFAPVRLLTW